MSTVKSAYMSGVSTALLRALSSAGLKQCLARWDDTKGKAQITLGFTALLQATPDLMREARTICEESLPVGMNYDLDLAIVSKVTVPSLDEAMESRRRLQEEEAFCAQVQLAVRQKYGGGEG